MQNSAQDTNWKCLHTKKKALSKFIHQNMLRVKNMFTSFFKLLSSQTQSKKVLRYFSCLTLTLVTRLLRERSDSRKYNFTSELSPYKSFHSEVLVYFLYSNWVFRQHKHIHFYLKHIINHLLLYCSSFDKKKSWANRRLRRRNLYFRMFLVEKE